MNRSVPLTLIRIAPTFDPPSSVDDDMLAELSEAEVPSNLINSWSSSSWSSDKQAIAPVELAWFISTNASAGEFVPKPILSAEPSIKKAFANVFVSALKSTEAPASLKVKAPPSTSTSPANSAAPLVLKVPVTSNVLEGEALLIPIRSLPASEKKRWVAVLPSILKSRSADDSLNTKYHRQMIHYQPRSVFRWP